MSVLISTELTIITVVLTLFFLSMLALTVELFVVTNKLRRVATRALTLIENVENASEAIVNMSKSGRKRFMIFRLMKSLLDLDNEHDKKD